MQNVIKHYNYNVDQNVFVEFFPSSLIYAMHATQAQFVWYKRLYVIMLIHSFSVYLLFTCPSYWSEEYCSKIEDGWTYIPLCIYYLILACVFFLFVRIIF